MREEEQEEEIEEEEIKKAVKKMKMKKAADIDGIPMETWKYAEETIWKKLVKLLGQIWKEGIILSEWKKGIIILLYKREDQEEVGNYRRILLLCIAYKVYAEILRTRLEKAVEEKNLIPESQTGFRKGKSAIDNILNYIKRKD